MGETQAITETPTRNSAYEQELVELRTGLLKMAGRVEQMIDTASASLHTRDPALVQKVIEEDRLVNVAELDIDELCLRILALRQPLGPDLRFITQALKMVTDLERIGDLAVNMAERARDLNELSASGIHPGIGEMAVHVRRMVGGAIDAFIERDVAKAKHVLEIDDKVDDLYERVFTDLLEQMRDDGEIHRGIHLQSAAKFLERMGDHACNLAEQVVFMFEGRDIRHPKSAAIVASRPAEPPHDEEA